MQNITLASAVNVGVSGNVAAIAVAVVIAAFNGK